MGLWAHSFLIGAAPEPGPERLRTWASCRFRDGQRAHVLHCVRCSRATLFCAILSDVHM